MPKKSNKKETSKPNWIAKTYYRIFIMSDEGHLKKHEGSTISYSGNAFNNYPGYESMEEAMKVIENYENSLSYRCRSEYIILPVVTCDDR